MKKPHKIKRARLLRELPTKKLPTSFKTLQSELRNAKLYNQALQEAIGDPYSRGGARNSYPKKSCTKQSFNKDVFELGASRCDAMVARVVGVLP